MSPKKQKRTLIIRMSITDNTDSEYLSTEIADTRITLSYPLPSIEEICNSVRRVLPPLIEEIDATRGKIEPETLTLVQELDTTFAFQREEPLPF